MEVLRTPDERFVGLAGWPYGPHYVEVSADPDADDGSAVRVHYVDEGDPDGLVVLMIHGEPSWAYLYRHMVPVLVEAGLRAVAVDLVGFGRSDKPTPRTEYTYARHVAWMEAVLLADGGLGLTGITLVGQDWGGLIGLRLVASHPDRFDRVVAANTFLPTGDQDPGEAFRRWRDYSQRIEQFDAGWIVNRGTVTDLAPEVVAAYDAPFPDESYKEGARQFPMLVPAAPDDPESEPNRRAWEALGRFDKPFLTTFGDSDPITRGGDRVFQALVPGAAGQPHTTIEGAGHFLQEDKGRELAEVVVDFVRRTTATQ
ncbi:MAG: haloalkane dehalogenase [Acidimicrobiales bacterium]